MDKIIDASRERRHDPHSPKRRMLMEDERDFVVNPLAHTVEAVHTDVWTAVQDREGRNFVSHKRLRRWKRRRLRVVKEEPRGKKASSRARRAKREAGPRGKKGSSSRRAKRKAVAVEEKGGPLVGAMGSVVGGKTDERIGGDDHNNKISGALERGNRSDGGLALVKADGRNKNSVRGRHKRGGAFLFYSERTHGNNGASHRKGQRISKRQTTKSRVVPEPASARKFLAALEHRNQARRRAARIERVNKARKLRKIMRHRNSDQMSRYRKWMIFYQSQADASYRRRNWLEEWAFTKLKTRFSILKNCCNTKKVSTRKSCRQRADTMGVPKKAATPPRKRSVLPTCRGGRARGHESLVLRLCDDAFDGGKLWRKNRKSRVKKRKNAGDQKITQGSPISGSRISVLVQTALRSGGRRTTAAQKASTGAQLKESGHAAEEFKKQRAEEEEDRLLRRVRMATGAALENSSESDVPPSQMQEYDLEVKEWHAKVVAAVHADQPDQRKVSTSFPDKGYHARASFVPPNRSHHRDRRPPSPDAVSSRQVRATGQEHSSSLPRLDLLCRQKRPAFRAKTVRVTPNLDRHSQLRKHFEVVVVEKEKKGRNNEKRQEREELRKDVVVGGPKRTRFDKNTGNAPREGLEQRQGRVAGRPPINKTAAAPSVPPDTQEIPKAPKESPRQPIKINLLSEYLESVHHNYKTDAGMKIPPSSADGGSSADSGRRKQTLAQLRCAEKAITKARRLMRQKTRPGTTYNSRSGNEKADGDRGDALAGPRWDVIIKSFGAFLETHLGSSHVKSFSHGRTETDWTQVFQMHNLDAAELVRELVAALATAPPPQRRSPNKTFLDKIPEQNVVEWVELLQLFRAAGFGERAQLRRIVDVISEISTKKLWRKEEWGAVCRKTGYTKNEVRRLVGVLARDVFPRRVGPIYGNVDFSAHYRRTRELTAAVEVANLNEVAMFLWHQSHFVVTEFLRRKLSVSVRCS